jgi:hypothetical protein
MTAMTVRTAETCAYPQDTAGEHDHDDCRSTLVDGAAEALSEAVRQMLAVRHDEKPIHYAVTHITGFPDDGVEQQQDPWQCVACTVRIGYAGPSPYWVADLPGLTVTWCESCVPQWVEERDAAQRAAAEAEAQERRENLRVMLGHADT